MFRESSESTPVSTSSSSSAPGDLRLRERIVCSSTDFSDEADPPTQLQLLVNRTVSSVEVVPSAWDLALHHSPDATLRVFNDASLINAHDAYSIFTPSVIATVTAGGGIKRKRRSE